MTKRVMGSAAVVLLLACGGSNAGAPSTPACQDGGCASQPPPPPAACSTPRPAWPAGRPATYASPIAAENALPGERGWFDGGRAPLDASGQRRLLELYTSRTSVRAGDTVEVKVHSSEPRAARWVLYRLGWYGGARARRVAEGSVPVAPQPACPLTTATGLVRCDWATTFAIPFGPDRVSGYYAVKVVRRDATGARDEYAAFAPLVVVDERPADLLAQAGTNTWQAYNDYGGESLYEDDSALLAGHKAVQVSFDRPFAGSGVPSRLLRYEVPFAQWLERMGYDVAYTTTNDVAVEGCAHVVRAGMYLQVGHDEYTPGGTRDAVEQARDVGVPLAFFSGNPLYWKVRLESFDDPRNPRVVTVYKSSPASDPDHADPTGRYRDAIVNRPENAVLGVMYESWQVVSFPLVVADGAGWLFRGTGLATGDVLRFLVGHEYDRRFPQFDAVEPAGVQVLLRSPVVDGEGTPGFGEAVTYRAPSGALVFAAGTIQWAYGVDDGPYRTHDAADPRVERMTANVFEEALGIPMPKPPQLAPRAAPPSTALGTSVATIATGLEAPAGIAALADGTVAVAEPRLHQLWVADPRGGATAIAGRRGVMGTVDGASVAIGAATFRAPTAALALPGGRIAISDTGNHVVRIVDRAAGTVTRLAGGMASLGFADGPAATARFAFPMGLALDGAGNVLVADSANQRIRAIAPDGTVSTLAGGGLLDPAPGGAAVPAAQLRLFYPTAVAVAADGTVYALSTTKVFAIAGGQARALAGATDQDDFADAAAGAARLSAFGGAALHGGALYFADAASYRLRRLDLATGAVETVAGGWSSGRVDGPADAARFALPVGVAASPAGTLYVSDAAAGAIREVTP